MIEEREVEKVSIEDLKKVLNTIVENGRKETLEEDSELIRFFKQNKDGFVNKTELIYLFVVFRLKKILTEAFGDGNVADILMNYNFFQHHIEYFISAAEGSRCVTDKAKHILRTYIRSRLKNKPFRITKGKKGDFWKTGLWTGEQSHKWTELIEALCRLLHGDPDGYLDFIESLLTA